jgi:4-coumarate--CoA ligase
LSKVFFHKRLKVVFVV